MSLLPLQLGIYDEDESGKTVLMGSSQDYHKFVLTPEDCFAATSENQNPVCTNPLIDAEACSPILTCSSCHMAVHASKSKFPHLVTCSKCCKKLISTLWPVHSKLNYRDFFIVWTGRGLGRALHHKTGTGHVSQLGRTFTTKRMMPNQPILHRPLGK